jgi:hypothetical protein
MMSLQDILARMITPGELIMTFEHLNGEKLAHLTREHADNTVLDFLFVQNMERQGWIEECDSSPLTDPVVRVYSITVAGRRKYRALAQEANAA